MVWVLPAGATGELFASSLWVCIDRDPVLTSFMILIQLPW